MYQRTVIACALALIVLGLAWELWLAPLRPQQAAWAMSLGISAVTIPASWLLSLKVLPLCLSLRGFASGHMRTFQWWSMGILLYLAEGLVRATSDRGDLSRALAWLEVVLTGLMFLAILAWVRQQRKA